MKPTQGWREKGKLLFIVMIPILISQVGIIAMNFFDTAMSGHAGAVDLAGVAIGSSLWIPIFTGLSGVLMALIPIISQSIGANKTDQVAYTVMQGLYVSIALSIAVIILGFIFLDPILSLMTLEAEVERIAAHYLIGLAFGILPLFMYTALRSFIDALGQTRVTMLITLLSLPVNIFLNYVLIFGKWGFPALGGVGAGYASAITYWFIFFVTIYFTHLRVPFSEYRIFNTFFKPSLSSWKEIFILGLPIGFTIFFETSIFAAVTLLISQFDTVTIAAHQAAINFASLLYMVPMSIAFALTIVVGYEVGAKRYKDAKQYSQLGIAAALCMAIINGIIIYTLREPVAFLYSKDEPVIILIAHFLVYAVFFQLSDAIATPIQGVLRGHKDVNIPFVIALISYWVIGLPLGYILANYTDLAAFGYWIGLITGLAAAAIALLFRLQKVEGQHLT